jgi:hypothetical protein
MPGRASGTLVPLLALAQVSHTPPLYESKPDRNEARVPHNHSGLEAATFGANLGSKGVGRHLHSGNALILKSSQD